MEENTEDLTYKVYEQLDAALTDHELNKNAEPRKEKIASGDWREGFVRGFLNSLKDMQSRLNNYKYQAKIPPEFLFQIEMRPPKNPNLAMICTLEYHKNYQFAAGLDAKDIRPVQLGEVYSLLAADLPFSLSTFEAALTDIRGMLKTPQFDSLQNRTIYELQVYGGLIVVVFAFFNAEKFPQEINPEFPKMFLWATYDAAAMGVEVSAAPESLKIEIGVSVGMGEQEMKMQYSHINQIPEKYIKPGNFIYMRVEKADGSKGRNGLTLNEAGVSYVKSNPERAHDTMLQSVVWDETTENN